MNYEEAKYYFENTIDGIKSTILFGVIADDNIQNGISYIKELTSCDDQTAKLIWCDLKMDYGTKANNPILLAREEQAKQKREKIICIVITQNAHTVILRIQRKFLDYLRPVL